MSESPELKVFISHRDSVCDECRSELGHGAWIFLAGERGARCLACADLEHLAFLAPGDAALTRRAKKHSQLWAVVLELSRARKRYERQGLLVEEQALTRAEQECLADADARERQRERNTLRRAELDQEFVRRFADCIRAQFPGCPPGCEQAIAEHACLKYSGRVGRSAAAKEFSESAVRLAVIAHLRHTETKYDELLLRGCDRHERAQIQPRLDLVLAAWAVLNLQDDEK